MKNLARYITTMLLVLTGAITATAQNDPFLPGDPGHAAPHHKLKIVSTEAKNIIIEVYTHSANGYFDMMYDDVNISHSDANISMTLAEGDSIKIWNSTYSWSGWEYTYMEMDGKKIHENQHLASYGDNEMPTFVMPNHDATIYVYATFDPSTPGVEQADNPYCGMWNAETGELFVNNFVPCILGYQTGYYGMGKDGFILVGAINRALYNYNISKADVRILTVSGEMGHGNDNIALENVHTLDLRHTYGYKSYYGLWYDNKTWYDNIFDQYVFSSALRRLILPSNIQGLSDGAFEGWNGEWKLEELTCYAVTPPMVNDNTLTPLPSTCVLYVPEQSVAAYKADKHWSRFKTIKGIQEAEDVTVDLPDNFTDGRYRGMSLELLNAENGESRKYVVDERGQYVYRGLVSGARYTALLRSPKNGIIAQTDTMLLDNQPIEMTFPRVVGMNEVLLTVKADGKDVTGDVTISWTDRKGASLGSGPKLEQQIEGSRVYYSIKLPSQLATLYQQPPTTDHIVGTNKNVIALDLLPLDSVSINGVVKDAEGNRIGGATVVIAQTVNGQISKSFVTTTDGSGRFALKALAGPVARSVSLAGYITNRQELTLSSEKTTTDTITLAPLSGAVISYDFTYTESGLTGEAVTTLPSYSDYQNVGITAYNATTRKELTDISVQYPQVVILSGAMKGDKIRLTATSMNSSFKPVEVMVTLDNDEQASVTIPIVQYGGIEVSFEQTDNSEVTASLYDGDGKLYQTYDYDEATIRLTEIPDGKYTIVTMGGSTMFSSILSLSDYATVGLKEGTDYVKNEVTVKSGEIVTVANKTIPVLDESGYFYTDNTGTTFKINKTEVSVGYNVTLRATLGFKQEYKNKVSNVSLIVDLPSNGQMVEGSAMTGTKMTRSSVSGNRVTIPVSIDDLAENTRFAVATTAEGSFTPTAYVQFKVDGREVLQPIGTVSCEVKGMTISVPETICDLTLPVQGTAPSRSFITIYSGDVELGQTTAREDGTFISYVELPKYPNLSKIPVHCKMTTKQGLEFMSQTATTTYDQDFVQVDHIYMWYEDQFIDFDYNRPDRIEEQSYSTGMSNMYTFAVEFNTTDSTKVVNPALYVKLTDGQWDVVENLKYNKDKGWWIGTYQLWHGEGVCNVDVDYQQGERDVKLDANNLNISSNYVAAISDNAESFRSEIDRLLDVMSSGDASQRLAALDDIWDKIGFDPSKMNIEVPEGMTFDQAMDYANKIISNLNITSDPLSGMNMYTVDFGPNMSVTHTTGLTPAQLLSEGYQEISTTDGHKVYVLNNEEHSVYVDFSSDIRIETKGQAAITRAGGFDFDFWYNTITNTISTLSALIGDIQKGAGQIRLWSATQLVEVNRALLYINSTYRAAGAPPLNASQKATCSVLKVWKWLCEGINKITFTLQNTGVNPSEAFQAFAQAPANTKLVKVVQGGAKALSKIGTALSFVSIISEAWEGVNRVKKLVELEATVPNPCKDDQEAATKLKQEISNFIIGQSVYYTGLVASDILSLEEMQVGLLAIPVPPIGISMGALLSSAAVAIIKMAANECNNILYENNIKNYIDRINALDCEHDHERWKTHTRAKYLMEKRFARNKDLNVAIDPSGFVYEGVTDNRVENATTTIYYKNEGYDEWGDYHNEAVKWDATEYSQQNPLLTDKEGKYQWFVPKGLWQVKVEKDGYETAYSDWLPVPPPQLDVNIGIVQKALPDVKTARAYEDGIEVEFNKYMRPKTLNASNIWLTQGSQKISCTIEQLNTGKTWEGDSAYVSRLLLRPSAPFNVGSKVGLFVRRQVESYAGLQMQNDYEQEFSVVREIRSLEVEPQMNVDQGKSRTFVLKANPGAAANGKKVTASIKLSDFITINEKATFNGNGEAQFTVSGLMPGETVVTFTMEETSATTQTIIRVLGAAETGLVAAPTASRISGTSVNTGETVTLHCATEGAQIWYTLDGSCPCDENGTRQLYTGPITITKDVELKAYAVHGEEVSEVATFNYYIATGIQGTSTAAKVPVAYYTPDGQRVPHPRKGINIVQYDDGSTKKIMVK